jgi:hexosaminidase
MRYDLVASRSNLDAGRGWNSRVPRYAITCLILCLLLGTGCARTGHPGHDPRLGLLPQPRSAIARSGELVVTAETPLVATDPAARRAAEHFSDLLSRSTGVSLQFGNSSKAGPIRFAIEGGMPPESYRLEVTPSGARLAASTYSGLYYGGVTLWQLLTAQAGQGGRLTGAAVTIHDSPRFAWRGLMLDSARHFQSSEFIKHMLDWMAVHKLNRFHWHLTDDQGWRIEIQRYPRLTEVGAWRVPASAPGTRPLPRIGGYYTQAQIREIVDYARERAIEVVPEIEMPGHALAAIRAYPELGTGVVPPLGIESDWGIFPYLFNVEEETFTFLENVLGEVLELFPGNYIHVGGDEAVKDQWRASPRVQARMRELGIADEEKLQSWFIARIARFLDARGRRLVGWDEILQGGLPGGATVMSWQGLEGAVKAARAGHDAVLTPAPTLYLDNRQAATSAEPPGRGNLVRLADIYAFDPVPASLTAAQQVHILGLQANLWTEHVRTEERAAHMAFPRAAAVAELGWSQPGTRDFAGFIARLVPQFARLETLGLRPAPSAFRPDAMEQFDPGSGRVAVTLSNQVNSEIRYTLDGSDPTAASRLYATPLDLALPARLRARGFHGARALPDEIDRVYDPASVRRRDDNQLKLCSENIALSLEDDAPADGPRAVFLIDIGNPCWIYADAPLDGVAAIEVEVGQLPFNFQIGKDIEKIRFRPPATPAGELEVRAGGCEGERIATLPLAPALSNPAVTRLRGDIAPRTGRTDLCITYTARGPDPLWAIDAVQLVPAR